MTEPLSPLDVTDYASSHAHLTWNNMLDMEESGLEPNGDLAKEMATYYLEYLNWARSGEEYFDYNWETRVDDKFKDYLLEWLGWVSGLIQGVQSEHRAV